MLLNIVNAHVDWLTRTWMNEVNSSYSHLIFLFSFFLYTQLLVTYDILLILVFEVFEASMLMIMLSLE